MCGEYRTTYNRWAYSQNEHATVPALVEVAKQMIGATDVNGIYRTEDGPVLLVVAIGMLQT